MKEILQLTFQVHFKGSAKELIDLKENVKRFLQTQTAHLFQYKERVLTNREIKQLGIKQEGET